MMFWVRNFAIMALRYRSGLEVGGFLVQIYQMDARVLIGRLGYYERVLCWNVMNHCHLCGYRSPNRDTAMESVVFARTDDDNWCFTATFVHMVG